jgi:hypothetical protein
MLGIARSIESISVCKTYNTKILTIFPNGIFIKVSAGRALGSRDVDTLAALGFKGMRELSRRMPSFTYGSLWFGGKFEEVFQKHISIFSFYLFKNYLTSH